MKVPIIIPDIDTPAHHLARAHFRIDELNDHRAKIVDKLDTRRAFVVKRAENVARGTAGPVDLDELTQEQQEISSLENLLASLDRDLQAQSAVIARIEAEVLAAAELDRRNRQWVSAQAAADAFITLHQEAEASFTAAQDATYRLRVARDVFRRAVWDSIEDPRQREVAAGVAGNAIHPGIDQFADFIGPNGLEGYTPAMSVPGATSQARSMVARALVRVREALRIDGAGAPDPDAAAPTSDASED